MHIVRLGTVALFRSSPSANTKSSCKLQSRTQGSGNATGFIVISFFFLSLSSIKSTALFLLSFTKLTVYGHKKIYEILHMRAINTNHREAINKNRPAMRCLAMAGGTHYRSSVKPRVQRVIKPHTLAKHCSIIGTQKKKHS